MTTSQHLFLTDPSLKPGHLVQIHSLGLEDAICERLHEMGLRIGTQLTILGRAPFGGPLLIRFKTSFMALRMEEAACATVILR